MTAAAASGVGSTQPQAVATAAPATPAEGSGTYERATFTVTFPGKWSGDQTRKQADAYEGLAVVTNAATAPLTDGGENYGVYSFEYEAAHKVDCKAILHATLKEGVGLMCMPKQTRDTKRESLVALEADMSCPNLKGQYLYVCDDRARARGGVHVVVVGAFGPDVTAAKSKAFLGSFRLR